MGNQSSNPRSRSKSYRHIDYEDDKKVEDKFKHKTINFNKSEMVEKTESDENENENENNNTKHYNKKRVKKKKKNLSKITEPHCNIVLKNCKETLARAEYGFSFINFIVNDVDICEEKRIYIEIFSNFFQSKVVCFDVIELYAWIRTNPNAKLEGPFGSLSLTLEQIKEITKTAEDILPKESLLEQESRFSWNSSSWENFLSKINPHISGTPEEASGRKFSNLCTIFTRIVLEKNGNATDKLISEAIEIMIVNDEEDTASQFCDLLVCSDHSILNEVDKYMIIKRAIEKPSPGVLSSVICYGNWVNQFTENMVTDLAISAIETKTYSTFKHLLCLLEDCKKLPKDQKSIDKIYICFIEHLFDATNWFKFFKNLTQKAPSISILCFITDQNSSNFKWIWDNLTSSGESKKSFSSLLEKLVLKEKFNLTLKVLEKFEKLVDKKHSEDLKLICEISLSEKTLK